MPMDNELAPDNWPARLAAEMAMGYYNTEELFLRCGQPREVFDALVRSPEFKLAVASYRKELHEGPSPLRMKAKRMLWDTMGELVGIARDDEVAAGDRIAAIREIAKLAGEAAEAAPAAQATAVVQIVRFSEAGPVVSVQ